MAAQAKINLRLRILAREASGFHQLETLFLRLELADRIRVRATLGDRTLDVGGDVAAALLGPTERNLAWRAASLYAQLTGWPAGFAIELEKRIPVGGGLGGGSADAGAVLRALDAIAPTPVGERALCAMGAELGADVPFLTTEHPFALAWGRGERMLALTPPARRAVLLVVPPFAINTAEAYGWLATRESGGSGSRGGDVVLDPESLTHWSTLGALAVNDFEPVVFARQPTLASLVARLRSAGCEPALMSGSGSTVAGVLPDGADPVQVAATLDADADFGRTLHTHTAQRVAPVEVVE